MGRLEYKKKIMGHLDKTNYKLMCKTGTKVPVLYIVKNTISVKQRTEALKAQ